MLGIICLSERFKVIIGISLYFYRTNSPFREVTSRQAIHKDSFPAEANGREVSQLFQYLMWFYISTLLIFNIILPTEQVCDYTTLVKCFINILDEWAWTLYELKDNVVTINEGQCEHLRNLDRCIRDSGPSKHQCDHNEIITASNTVSDLLTHRKNSGSFLKSYYLLTYACSQEGQDLLQDHRECLTEERIGEMTLSAGTYLSEKFLDHADDQVCTEVNNKLQEYISAMKGICHSASAQLIMCKSLTNMFKGLHADKLHNCHFDCDIDDLSEEYDNEDDEPLHHRLQAEAANDDEVSKNVPESESLNSASLSSYLAWSLLMLVVSVVAAW